MPRPHAARRQIGAVAVGFGLLVCVGGGGGVASAAVVDYTQGMSDFIAGAGAGAANSAVAVNFDDGTGAADVGAGTLGGAMPETLDPSLIIVEDIYQDETDIDNSVGHGSFRFAAPDDRMPQPPGVSIPLPAALLSTPLMLAVAELARRRMRS